MARATVLVAEDEPSIRRLCVRALGDAGFDAAGAASGEEAVRLASEYTVDALVTDISMPGIDGLETCRRVRSGQPNLATIVMTGYGTMETAIDALKAGVSEFVLKPFHPKELIAAVERALEVKRLERENARLRTLIPLFDISKVLMSSVDLAEVPSHVVRVARAELQATSASVLLLNAEHKLRLYASEGLPQQAIDELDRGGASIVSQYAVDHGVPVIIQGDLADDERFAGVQMGTQRRPTSGISIPLTYNDQAVGVLNVSRQAESQPFSAGDMEFLSVLAGQAAVAIENARLLKNTQDAYQRLEELDQLKSEFIGIASHELRAPLATMMAYASLLEVEAPPSMREHLVQVIDAAVQLKSIIDEMVNLRRIDTRETQIALESVPVAPVISTLIGEIGPMAKRRQISISVDLPDDLPAVRADQQVMSLILGNLLSNAVKFTPENGRVEVVGHASDRMVHISVKDTGVGIAPEQIDRIFARFYQVENSLRREHGGIGLGLAIAQEMADLLDGKISVESTVGLGSSFTLSLPSAE